MGISQGLFWKSGLVASLVCIHDTPCPREAAGVLTSLRPSAVFSQQELPEGLPALLQPALRRQQPLLRQGG